METLFQQIALVGDIWVLWLLMALSLLGGAVFFERLRLLRREAHLAQQTATLLHGPKGRGTVADSPAPAAEGAVSRVVADLERQNTGHTDLLEQVLQAALLFERRDLERRLAILGTIGSNAPFIGLLGTVLGVIQAFHDLALAGDGGTGVVMSGIASALVITAAGLVVAIPAVIANNYFRTMIEDILSCAEAAGRLRLAAIAARPATAEIAGGIPR